MKTINIFCAFLLLFVLAFSGANAQSNTQVISYKIDFKSGFTNCYDVTFRVNQSLNAPTNARDKVSSAQVTIVAPVGTSSLITNLTAASGILFNPTSSSGNFEVNAYPGDASMEYITFGIRPFDAVVAANTDFLLFSFCLNDCRTLRLINGVSPDSPHTYSGTPDTKPASLDPYNSMSFNTGSAIILYEAYQGNNSGQATCVSPDLTVSISTPTANGTIGANFSYTICANNIGTGPTTANQTATMTLPAGLTFVSAGNGTWSCNNAAGSGNTTLVTCTSSSPIAATSGTSCFPMVVNPTGAASYTTNVVVSGGGETNTGNNATSAALITAACGISAGTLQRN